MRFVVKGLTEYISKLEELGRDATPMIKRSLYEGAGVMADALSTSIQALPVRDPDNKPASGKMVKGVTQVEKTGLAESFGIARMRTKGSAINTLLGFDGVNADGVKNQTIARRMESGTSKIQATNFISKTVNANRAAALKAMDDEFTNQLRERMNGGL